MAQDKTPNLKRFTAYKDTTERVATINATGDLLADKDVIIAFLSDATAISLLTDTGNWDSSGAYIGTAITGTYAGQYYYDDDYYFFAVADNSWIRLPRTSDTAFGTIINKATAKTTPVDADMVGLIDSAASNILKKLSWANIKATLKTYFDTLYSTINISRVSVTGTDSLESSDNGKVIEFSSGSDFTFTLDQMSDGFNCTLVNINTGDVTIAAGSGVTIRHESANRKLTTQYRGVSLYYRSATEVVIVGTLEA